MNTRQFASSTLQLLQANPSRYRCFGVYWYMVKALMKQYYTRDNLYLLGDHMDQSVIDRVPDHKNLQEALAAAIETYNENVTFGMGSAQITDPDGEVFTLSDPDDGGL